MRAAFGPPLIALALVAESACQPIADLPLPDLGSAASRILAYSGPSEADSRGVGLYALEPAAPADAFNSPVSRSIYVLDYAASLDELAIPAGHFPEQNGLGRELPLPTTAFRKTEDDGWTMLAPDDALMVLGHPRIPGLSPELCRGAPEGCYHYTDQLYCERPCQPQLRPTLPAAPMSPELPDLLPCPSGYQPVETMLEDRALTWCAPPAFVACGVGEAQFLGTTGCSPIGSPCPPAGEFSSALPTGRSIIYVSEGAMAGTGSELQPFGTLAEAIASANSQDVIALAGGRYAGGVELPAGVELIGACVADTIVESSDAPALTFSSAARAQNLRIEGERGISINGSAGMRVELASIQVSTHRSPIAITGSATLSGDRLSILGTPLVVELESNDQVAILASAGAHIDLRDVSIVDGVFKGIAVDASSARLSRISLLRLRSQVSGFLMWGLGVHAYNGGKVHVRQIASEENGGATLGAWNPGSLLDAEQIVIQKTIPRQPPIEMHQNFGLDAFAGADLVVRKIVIRDSEESGLWIFNDNSVTVEDALFEDLGRYGIKTPNAGGVLQTFRRVAIHDVGVGGALLSGRCDLSDLTIVGVGSRAVEDDSIGVGVSVRYGDTRLERALISGVASVGLEACGTDAGDRLTVNDLTVRAVDDRAELKSSCIESAGPGVGVQVFGRGGSRLTRTSVDDVRGVGVVGLRLTGVDLDVSNSGSEGVRLFDTANLDRARIHTAHYSGLTVIGARSEVRALTVIDTLTGSNDGVPAPVDPLQAAGVALRARAFVDLSNTTPRMLEGALMVDDFYLSGAAAFAVELDATSTLRLDRGAIVDGAAGVRTNNPNPGSLTIAPTVSIQVRGDPFVQNQ